MTWPVTINFERGPEFHLDELLELLSTVPDGQGTKRATINSATRAGAVVTEPGWECDAGGYGIDVLPDYSCGFDELGDGKVLTVVTARLADRGLLGSGTLRLSTAQRAETYRYAGKTSAYSQPYWVARVALNPGGKGRGESLKPGTAALLAYLRAWGALTHEEVQA